jgi:cardiolipin synthase
LHEAGVHVVEFHPLTPWKARHGWWLNARDHRKILVADGERAIVGGVNLSSTYESAPGGSAGGREPGEVWHDIDAEITGPAVLELEKLFLAHWNDQAETALDLPEEATQVQESGDEIVRVLGSNPRRRHSPYYTTALSAIRNAEASIWLMAAYFVPTHREMHDLIAAAHRGVDVTLLLPARSDSGPALAVQRSHYGALLQAGVKIYERDDGILHSKMMVVDRVWCMVGSSNFDRRSVLFNDEVDVVLLGRSTGDQLSEAFKDGVHHAHTVDLQEWKHRPVLTRLNEQFWRLWEGLL